MPRKLALMTGIANYPAAPLPGPIDDVIDFSHYLFGGRGFGKADVIPVTNQRATTKNILTYLEQIVDILQPGDFGMWYYSGHGAQFPTHNLVLEPDGLDEVLCPYDFDWTPEHMITDKQIAAILRKLRPDVNFVWISDSCHSGDMTRDMPMMLGLAESPMHPRINKAYPVPRDIRWTQEAALDAAALKKEITPAEFPLNIAYISGCKAEQTSTDAFFDSRYNGALTYFLLKILKDAPPTITVREMVVKVNQLLHDNGFKQEAQAEGLQIGNPFLMPILAPVNTIAGISPITVVAS